MRLCSVDSIIGPVIGKRRIGLIACCLLAVTPFAGQAAPAISAPGARGTAVVRGTWRLLPPAPSPVPTGTLTVSVWTGRQMVIFGRAYPKPPTFGVDVAAAYTPATGKWTRLLPLKGPAGNAQGSYHAVWTGKEMLVLGPNDFQAFNPRTNRWRRLARAPSALDGTGLVVWTGREMIDWGGGCCGDALSAGWAYNPAASRWRSLPRSPLAPSAAPTGAWTGREFVIFVSGLNPEGKPYPARYARAAAYIPTTNRWRRITPLSGLRIGATTVWDGRDVLFVAPAKPQIGRPPSPGKLVFAYRPATNRWRQLASMPAGRGQFAAAWSGKRLILWGGTLTSANIPQSPATGVAYDPRRDRWLTLPRSPLRPRLGALAVWTGRAVMIWGGWTIGTRFFADGAIFTPAA